MPHYLYTAKYQPNAFLEGDIEADSLQDAIDRLGSLGYFPLSLQLAGVIPTKKSFLARRQVTRKEICLFTQQLASLLESGINILESLRIINQTSQKFFKAVLNDIIGKIKDGKTLSESLSEYPELFPELYISMIRSGELGGTLEATIKRLANFLEKAEEFKGSVRSSLAYPLFVLITGVFTVVVLLWFVIPRLVFMFQDMGQALPLPTQVLISLSSSLRAYWWLILSLCGIAVFSLLRSLQNPEGKLFWDGLKLKAGLFGQIILKRQIGSFARTLSMLLSGGIPIVQALDISAAVVNNRVLQQQMRNFKEEVSKGASLCQAMKEAKTFPAFVIDIVTVGEETGTLEKALLRIADTYEKEVDAALKDFTRLLEPVVILIIGLIVGFIVISMLLPIFQINLLVK